MAYQTPFGQQNRFRETLKYEDIIHNQIESIREIFNSGDSRDKMAAVKSLALLIAPYVDEQYLREKKQLDEDAEIRQKEVEREFERKLRQAHGGCPDLVERPSEDKSEEYWEMLFMIANSFMQRKDLGLKNRTEANA